MKGANKGECKYEGCNYFVDGICCHAIAKQGKAENETEFEDGQCEYYSAEKTRKNAVTQEND